MTVVTLMQVESDWHHANKMLRGAGVGTSGSAKRKMFELISSHVWSDHTLRMTFTSPTSCGLARSLGRFKRWPVKMICTTQKMPDLVRNVGDAVSEPAFVAPAASTPVDGPSNRALANGLFQRTDPSTCVCRLCSKAYIQAASKGYDNLRIASLALTK
jgi:hypothetical protein